MALGAWFCLSVGLSLGLGLGSRGLSLSFAYLIPFEIWHNNHDKWTHKSLKTSFFKKPWESKDETARAEAVGSLTDPKLIEKLPEIAQHDPCALVRLQALKRINTEPFWLDARQPNQDPQINAAADKALVHAALTSEPSPYHAQRLAWLDQLIEQDQHRDWIQKLAKQAPHPQIRAKALGQIKAMGFLADCLVEETDAKIWQQILTQIHEPGPLERILGSVKKNSKAKTQAVEARLASLQGIGQSQQTQQQALQCLASLEQLILRQGSVDLASQWQRILMEWQALDSPSDKLVERFERGKEIVEAMLHPPVPAKTDANSDANPDANSDANSDQTMADVQTLEPPAPNEKPVKPPKTKEKPSGQRPNKLRDHELETEQCRQALAAAQEAIDQGQLKKAHAHLANLQHPMPKAVGPEYTRIFQQLQELKKWLHWSNNAQRDELIAQLEHAIDQSLHPDALRSLAAETKEKWKALETSEKIDPTATRPIAPHRQWHRLQQAMHRAHEKIQPALEHRQSYQSENLAALDGFLTQARSTLTDPKVSHKILLEQRRTAAKAIRRLDDLPPKSRSESAKALKELLGALSARIEQHFQTIEQEKQRLVTKAGQLAHEKDATVAVEMAKALQAEWKRIGPGRRASDQALWEAFRAPIDPLFASIKQANDAVRAEQQEHHQKLQLLVGEIDQLAKDSNIEDTQWKAKWARLNDQWLSEANRPARLETQFEKAKNQIETRIRQAQQAAKTKAKQDITDLANRIQAQWSLKLQGETSQGETNQGDPIQIEIGEKPSAEQWVACWESLAEAASQLNSNAFSLDHWQTIAQNHDQQARQVVVEMEFLAGLDCPKEDEPIKKAFQVERLNERLNQRGQGGSLGAELANRVLRWHQAIPMQPQTHQTLEPRFRRAQDVLEQMLG